MRESNLQKAFFGFEKIMDIDNHNLAYLVGKVMDEIMDPEYQIFLPKCTER